MDKNKKVWREQSRMCKTIDRIQEAINDLTKLQAEGAINRELYLMIFDKITEGRNYLVGAMETKRP